MFVERTAFPSVAGERRAGKAVGSPRASRLVRHDLSDTASHPRCEGPVGRGGRSGRTQPEPWLLA